MEIPQVFGSRHVPIPNWLVEQGFRKEIKAYTYILNAELRLEDNVSDRITEKLMLQVIQAELSGGQQRADVMKEMGRWRYDAIVRKFQERTRAHNIMFGITSHQIKEVVLNMKL